MQKTFIIIIILCDAFISFSQLPNWELDLASDANIFNHLGQINETDNSILFIKKHEIHEVSYYGEPLKKTTLDFDFTASSAASINTLFQRNINNEDVYVTASSIGTHLYFNVSSLEGNLLGTSFDLSGGNLNGGVMLSNNVFEKTDNEFLVFGRNHFDIIKLNSDYTWNIVSTIQHDYTGINSVKKAENNYIITTSTGTTALLTQDFATIWSIETSVKLTAASKIPNGYMVCGNDAENGIAHVIRLDNTGIIISQQNYPGKVIFDLLPWNENILLAGSSVFMVDDIGNIVWEKQLPKGINNDPSINLIQKSQFGAVLMMSEENAYLLNINSASPFSEYRTLSSNDIGGHVTPWGDLNFNGGSLEYPINEGTSTIFTNAPVFVGQTESGMLSGFFENYYNGSEIDGVISDNPMSWKIYQSEIDIIQERLAEGIVLAPYSQALLTYPGKGNPNCVIDGENISIENDFAPFIDVNGDDIYNMFDGDYPEMKGDQMIWWASKYLYYNSNMEVHGRWYAYNCGNHIISNTIYVDYKLFNKSDSNLSECFFGQFIDFDLGCDIDDYIGSLPSVNSVYAYNETGTDGENCDNEVLSFNTEIPIQSITFLSDEMTTAMFYYDTFFNHSIVSPPNTHEETYNYLQGKYKDDTPLTYGGNGYNTESSDFTSYVYPGNPSNPDEWSMASENVSTNADYFRMITATGTFDLNIGESKTFTFAYTTHPNIPHPAPDVTPVIASIQEVIDIYDNENAFTQVFLGQDQSISVGESINLNAGDDGLDYLWSTGENTAIIEVSTPGTYTVTVTDETGCQRSDEININASSGLSTIEVSHLSIYPNPAESGANISIQMPIATQISKVELFNTVGQKLYSEKVNTSTQTLTLKLPAQINAGIYTIQIMAVDGELLVGKMIID